MKGEDSLDAAASDRQDACPASTAEDVTLWFRSLQQGDQTAAEKLWEHCVPRLVRYSKTRLPARLRKALDEEDVALSAFKSLCAGAQDGRLQSAKNRQEIWNLLACIAARKASTYVKGELRQKRGGGQVRGESIFITAGAAVDNSDASGGGLDSQPMPSSDGAQTPAEVVELAEQCQLLLDALDDDGLRTIALLRLEGYSVDDIAERIGCAKRSVERRLALIRQIWLDGVG